MYKERRNGKPLIHCITNPIAMNQSANAILAFGARPIMAEHPQEVEEITETASALLLNLGNISDNRIEAMKLSLQVANDICIPVVLDAVGVACSKLRYKIFEILLQQGNIRVIKGNYSEILALANKDYRSSGVDSSEQVDASIVERSIRELSSKYNSIVVATGEKDLLGEKERLIKVAGGCNQMSSVTGTGCMLGALIATELAFDDSLEGVEKVSRYFKCCGEKAATEKGGGTFMVNLLDNISNMKGAGNGL